MINKKLIYPVPNKWVNYGWTLVNLKAIKKDMLMDVLTTAYCNVAPGHLQSVFLEILKVFKIFQPPQKYYLPQTQHLYQ